ncbi:G-type lectin S-receptor-like serine/threonine-protein kinase SD2-5 [Canna indica]|uniref:G-type lectin S-receptor-like serine/threonine-protein kinase SD2-5 n=1 Tax=Canna indica TaxID=4628 RepID=A0AAQ3JSZ2_9LILI|nr:G-type lectin S-receptor-like serine/threonine-protein kinase SD2-5 [Canna indica]
MHYACTPRLLPSLNPQPSIPPTKFAPKDLLPPSESQPRTFQILYPLTTPLQLHPLCNSTLSHELISPLSSSQTPILVGVPMEALLFLLLTFFLPNAFCKNLSFPVGGRVAIPLPSLYQPDFVGRAFLISANNDAPPQFRAGLSIEAVQGGYSCSIVVLLGDVKVWASDHVAKFFPAGSCVLELTPTGDLQLKDSSGRIGWRSGTLGLGVQSLHLKKNTGNLILIDGRNQTKWQSFDYPSNTMLWGQRLNSSSQLTLFPINSSSFYSFEIEQDKLAAYLNWRGNKYSYWELKPRAGKRIAFIRLGSKALKAFNNNSAKIAQISAMKPETVRFLALGRKGNLGLYYYSASQGRFEASHRALEFCDLPLPCGPYGICSSTKSCSYLQVSGMEYRASFCGLSNSEVEMVELKRIVSVLRTSSPIANVSKEECLASCLEDCSCAAALYLNGHGDGSTEELCYQYGLVGGAREIEIGNLESNFWVKVAKKGSGHEEKSSDLLTKVLIVGGAVDVVALCVILGGFLYYFFKVRKRSVDSGTDNN